MRKTIRAFVLVLALAVPVFAGEIPNGAKGEIPNGVTATGYIPNGVAGDIPNGVTGDIPYGVIDALLSLLALI